jgi:membrane protein implicated in regulation of membrane protease activity
MDLGTNLAFAFIIIGILMMLAEAASPGAFILVPATVLVVLGVGGLIWPGMLLDWTAPVVALVTVLPITLVTIKLYQKLAPPAPPQTVVATSLVGTTGVVERTVEPFNLKGKVRIDHDVWSATSTKTIPAGARVVVKASEGVHVTVEEAPQEPGKAS